MCGQSLSEEFIQKAAEAGDPRKFKSQLPGILKEAIEYCSKATEGKIARTRTVFSAKWTDGQGKRAG